jgi:hypothetical protein
MLVSVFSFCSLRHFRFLILQRGGTEGAFLPRQATCH